MVVEYIRYNVPASRRDEFEATWSKVQTELEDAPQCLTYEVAQGIEDPEHYIVRIEWTSLEDHEHGFRSSPGFGPFFAAVKPFFEQIEEMRHYQRTGIVSPVSNGG